MPIDRSNIEKYIIKYLNSSIYYYIVINYTLIIEYNLEVILNRELGDTRDIGEETIY